MVKEPSFSTMDIDNLDFYYEDCVIGGPAQFVVSIKDRDKFKEAIRSKLLLEVADRIPSTGVVPAARQSPGFRVRSVRNSGRTDGDAERRGWRIQTHPFATDRNSAAGFDIRPAISALCRRQTAPNKRNSSTRPVSFRIDRTS